MNKRIEVGYKRAQQIQYGRDPEFEREVETERISWAGTSRWLEIYKRVSDGALFALQVETYSEKSEYETGHELIPIESTDVVSTRRVWHEPGAVPSPTEVVNDGRELLGALKTLL